MAKIPLGNFGFEAPQAAPPADTSAVAQGIADIGQGIADIAHVAQQKRILQARVEAANADTVHQIAVGTAAQDVADKLATGEISPDEAQASYEKATSALPKPDITNLPPVEAQNLDRKFKLNVFAASQGVHRAAEATRRTLFKDQFNQGLDNLGKLAGMPNADIETINAKADAYAQVGTQAGVPKAEVDKAIQNFKDQNWLNHATQRAMESADSMQALTELQHDLTAKDGYYAGRLDTDKRNGVLRAVLADKAQLEAKLEHAADRREARATVAMNEIDRQIASGVPATAGQWAEWATVMKGTTLAGDFKTRIADENQVQEVLRMPVADQVKYVQDRQAALQSGGGSLREAANVARLTEAVTKNVNLLQQAPLLFNANRTGDEVAPLDVGKLSDPNSTEIAAQMRDRVITLQAMRKQYGEQVPLRPLLPQEAALLAGALNSATPDQAADLFGTLRNVVGSDEIYKGVMQQIAPDSPVKSLAGLLAARQRSITLERNWVRNDVIASSRGVAGTILQGQELLAPTKTEKNKDGKPNSKLFLPETTTLQQEFQDQVGGVFAGRPGAADVAFQAVQAYYVGKAAQSGRLAADSKDIDTGIVKEAITATLGEVVDYNGNGEVLAPWGMDAAGFEDRVKQAFAVEAKRRDLPPDAATQLPSLGLRNAGDGTYYVVQGRNFIYDKKGDPLVIDVLDPTSTPPPPLGLDWTRVK